MLQLAAGHLSASWTSQDACGCCTDQKQLLKMAEKKLKLVEMPFKSIKYCAIDQMTEM